ncbi:aminoglycoside phosphotransferase/kinase family protein [Sporosarcina sp. ITBMC105]
MTIGLEIIKEVLSLYNIKGQVTTVYDFIHYRDENELKIISKVDFTDRDSLVIKFVREDKHPSHIIESQSAFSEYLRSQGISTPRRYLSEDKYCIQYKLDYMDVDITLEDYIGEEIRTLDTHLATKVGELMGKIHTHSENGNCLIGQSTIFDLLGYNEVSGYNTFCELGETHNIDVKMYQKIKELYHKRLEKIRVHWNTLPRFATQGDISINNLTYVGDTIGIFDYNIAGDETLVGDMVLEGLLLAYEMDLSFGLTDNDRAILFQHFIQGYLTERPLTVDEKNVLSDIYSIAFAFWFTKIKYDEHSLEKLIERNEQEKVGRLLHEIYTSLVRNEFDEQCELNWKVLGS